MPPRTRPQTVYASKSMFICGPFYPAGPLSARLPVGSDAVSAAPGACTKTLSVPRASSVRPARHDRPTSTRPARRGSRPHRTCCDSGRLPSVRVSRRGDPRLHRRDLDQVAEGRNGSRREPGSQTTAASAPPPTTSREPKPSTDVSTHQSELPALLDEVLELHASLGGMTARLKAIQDLAVRLNRIQDVRGIAEAIVAEVHNLIEYDSIRVYQGDHVAGMCEPLAFRGQFLGTDAPDPSLLRLPIGRGMTGWVAEHGE